MNFRALALVKSESWKSPENFFSKKVAHPVFRMQQFYFLIFMGEVIPKIEGTGWGGSRRTGKESVMKSGVMDYLSNTTNGFQPNTKSTVPHEGILLGNNRNKGMFI